ncbi:hypothetical protein GLOIN_2v1783703 [Rhizophagus clarus]|uniref:Uncharacterized protein n=1 Tax=Rhizophagus clarus TaxID=94130 RepID=A0A8H3QJC3_9GLOM|nr:hypothetical protein GLOIN_2v1783703 [Rhizophagus clarus]
MSNCTYCNKVFNDRQALEDDNAEVNLSDDESMTESSDEDSVISNLLYKGIEYEFEYRTVLDGIHQILMNKDIIKDFIFESVKDTPNKRQYTDMYDSDWWRDVEKNLPIGAYVMPIILYADATLCNHLGKTSRHPVFMTLGNIPLACRNKVDAKILLGYIPNLEYCNWPEACAMGAIYGSSNSSHPYHFCLVDRNTLNNVHIKKENIIIRNEHDTKNVLRQGNGKQISTYYIRNALWKRLYFNIYTSMCVPDCMHHADLSLFQYQLRFTVELLNLKYGSSSIKILEERLSQIPRYPNFKIFKSGFERLNRLTASEYRDLMKNSIIVWNDLFIKLMSKFSPSNLNLPKLHSWRFHLIPSIYQFGAVSGFTSEIYELLHKTNVKQPYRMTNKRQINK